jgi:hypothetical protein
MATEATLLIMWSIFRFNKVNNHIIKFQWFILIWLLYSHLCFHDVWIILDLLLGIQRISCLNTNSLCWPIKIMFFNLALILLLLWSTSFLNGTVMREQRPTSLWWSNDFHLLGVNVCRQILTDSHNKTCKENNKLMITIIVSSLFGSMLWVQRPRR